MDKGRIELNGKPSDVYNDKARLIGIGLPRVTMLFHLLRAEGFQSLRNPTTVEQASEELRRVLRI